VRIFVRYFVSEPTVFEIDIRLSFRTISMSFCDQPAMFSASKAIPAPIDASPITTTAFRSSRFSAAPVAMPRAWEIDVPAWPPMKWS